MPEITTEKMFTDFVELLKTDSEDKYTGHLFRFIQHVLESTESTMDLGKNGFSPVLNFTVYAKQFEEKMEIVLRPSRSASREMHNKLQMVVLTQKLCDAINEYGKEAWGMTPIDERQDIQDVTLSGVDAMAQWGHLAE